MALHNSQKRFHEKNRLLLCDNDLVGMVVRNFVFRKVDRSNIIKGRKREGKGKEGKEKRLPFTKLLLCASKFTDIISRENT